jgi:hypothetical protein
VFWRVLIVIGGLTFLINGCQILGNEDCNSVDLGGTHRVISYSCLRSPNAGEMSGGAAGGLGVAIGLGMILLATWPAIQNVIESRQPSTEPPYRPTTPPSEPPPETQTPPSPSPGSAPEQGRTRPCPYDDCEGEVSAAGKFCGYCGRPITASR